MAQVWKGYATLNPSYHNGIHGADVCQMTYIQLTTGGIANLIRIDALDTFSVLLAVACHDLRHDGFTNNYHGRTKSERFKRYGEAGCQEQFHFAESYALIQKNNLLEKFNKQEQTRFRRRM